MSQAETRQSVKSKRCQTVFKVSVSKVSPTELSTKARFPLPELTAQVNGLS